MQAERWGALCQRNCCSMAQVLPAFKDPLIIFPDDSGHADLVASSTESKYNDVAPSLDKARCFNDSEPDDSLLELSDSEQGNSPFNYTEEEIQEILADDCLECEQHITRKSTLSQNVSGESEKDVSSSCTGASVVCEDAKVASKITEKSKVHLSVQATDMLFDLDIEELLNLSPIDADYVDQPLEDDYLEDVEFMNDHTACDQTDASNCFPRESSGRLMPKGEQTLGVDCLGKTSSAGTDVSNTCGDHVGKSMPCSDLACGQHKADDSAAPVLLRSPKPSSGSGNQELPKATTNVFSRKSDSPTDDMEQESSDAKQPSGSIEINTHFSSD